MRCLFQGYLDPKASNEKTVSNIVTDEGMAISIRGEPLITAVAISINGLKIRVSKMLELRVNKSDNNYIVLAFWLHFNLWGKITLNFNYLQNFYKESPQVEVAPPLSFICYQSVISAQLLDEY